MLSDVQNFYSGKTILITGATGFLGQVLLSKLLCSCQDLRRIYVLIREIPGKTIQLRLQEVFDHAIFARVKELNPDLETKVKPIRGDCIEKHLGISDSDRAIIENEVDIIFYVAATVKFTESLRAATYINIRSIDTMLDIAKNMKNLKAFVYVSTGYSPCVRTKCIEEKFYDPPIKAESLVPLVEHLDDTVLDQVAPKLMNSYPNWYIYTKLVAENICREKGADLPLSIFRPVGVIPCFKEPLPGWINNSYGVIGVVHAHALGIVKTAPVNKDVRACVVPGDYCANALILTAYYTSLQRENKQKKWDAPVINYSNCITKFRVTWGSLRDECDKSLEKYPFNDMVFLPYIMFFKNYFVYQLLAFFLHLVPATICDLGLIVVCKKPRCRKLCGKLHEFLDLLWYFSNQEWTVINNNIDDVWSILSDKDKELFYCNLNHLDIREYFDTMVRGVRLYVVKDREDSVQKAKEKRRKIRIAFYSSIFISSLTLLYFLRRSFGFVSCPSYLTVIDYFRRMFRWSKNISDSISSYYSIEST